MSNFKSAAPTAGLILVILSIIILKLESSLFGAASFLMVLLGLILILLPDLRKTQLKPKQPLVRSGLSTVSSLSEESSDRCAICGRPVPPDVAYCDGCAKKGG